MITRRVEPEWLDALPADDPRAVRCRRDLRLMNRIMAHAGMIGQALRTHVQAKRPRVAELGAGDGTLMLRVACDMTGVSGAELTLVDQQPVVSGETISRYAEKNWHATVRTADVFDWLAHEHAVYDVIVANLFLHHCEPPQLAKLLALAASRTTLFVACEPRRARFPLVASKLVGLLGCNDVTRHDVVLSVRAGFCGEELSRLWPASQRWLLEEGRAGLFSHRFVAQRRD